ncbi:MAG: MFS transporter [Pseudomonadota bacterium]
MNLTASVIGGLERPNIQRNALICAYLLTAIAVMGAASVVPALPFLSDDLGISPAQAAWVIGFFIAPAVVLTPLIGFIADRFGLKPTVICSLLLYGINAAACVLANSFMMLVSLRLLQGVGAAALELLALVIIASVATGNEIRKAMGRNAAVIGISLCVYPFISGILIELHWRLVFLMGLTALPVAVFVYVQLDQRLFSAGRSSGRSNLWDLFNAVRKPAVRTQYVLIIGLFILLFGCFFSFMPEAAIRSGITSGSLLGTIPLIMAAAIATTAPFMNQVAEKMGERNLCVLAASLYAASMMLALHAKGYILFGLSALLFGVAHGLLFPLTQSVLGRNTPAGNKGLFMSANAMAIATGQTIGPFLIGLVVTLWTLDASFYLGIAIAVSIAVISSSSMTQNEVNIQR